MGKGREVISLSTFYKNLHFDKSNIRKALLGLKNKGIIVQLTQKTYEIQLSIDKWKIEPKKPKKKKVGQLTQSVGQLTQNEATKCSISKQQQTPKETVLKETKEQQ